MGRFIKRTGFYDRRSVIERTVHHEFDRRWGFTGGARVRWSNASIPFAKLEFDTEIARLTVSSGLLGGPFWIWRAEVTQVVGMTGALFSPGVMFATEAGSFNGLIFWTLERRTVLQSFAAAGWPVAAEFRPPPPGAA